MNVLLPDESWKILTGDSLALLRTFPADTFHCCVTSPPYFGLRDYGTGKWEGGDAGCDHKGQPWRTYKGGAPDEHREFYRHTCGKCGATRVDQQIGLERSPAEFVARLVEVFSEVKRVLRPDGTCWVNMGDSYSGGKMGRSDKQDGGGLYKGLQNGWDKQDVKQNDVPPGLKPKDLLGMPWRLAFALQESGWYLRSEIIWAKSSPMPESVRDRPTKSHEQIFLLTREPRYFYDQDAERVAHWHQQPDKVERYAAQIKQYLRRPPTLRGSGETATVKSGRGYHDDRLSENPDGRNLWTVWDDLRPEPFPAAHFATFPPDLPARCIRLGTSAHGVCRACGAPWVRVKERARGGAIGSSWGCHDDDMIKGNFKTVSSKGYTRGQTLGWEPSCDCEAGEPVPALVLDPFAGAATTGLVARRLGRRFVGIELNPEYAEMGRKRIAEDAPMFNASTVATSAPEPSLFDTLEDSE